MYAKTSGYRTNLYKVERFMDTPTLTIFKQDPAPKNAFISLNSNHKYPLEQLYQTNICLAFTQIRLCHIRTGENVRTLKLDSQIIGQ